MSGFEQLEYEHSLEDIESQRVLKEMVDWINEEREDKGSPMFHVKMVRHRGDDFLGGS